MNRLEATLLFLTKGALGRVESVHFSTFKYEKKIPPDKKENRAK